jgi:hypothetical protein
LPPDGVRETIFGHPRIEELHGRRPPTNALTTRIIRPPPTAVTKIFAPLTHEKAAFTLEIDTFTPEIVTFALEIHTFTLEIVSFTLEIYVFASEI